jgi:hypothetical protein
MAVTRRIVVDSQLIATNLVARPAAKLSSQCSVSM